VVQASSAQRCFYSARSAGEGETSAHALMP